MARDFATPPDSDERPDLNSLVPLAGTDLPILFDPDQSSALIRRGLDRLLAAEAVPSRDGRGSLDPSRALSACTLALGRSMLAQFDAMLSSRRLAFTKDQRLLALACLYICAHAGARPAPTAMHRLGAITDLVADENRFWWWNALPLQLALNVVGEGNGGYRTLYGNLAHPHDALRREMVSIGWIARDHLDLQRLAAPLLANVETKEADWPGSLALLRAASPDEEVFRYVVDHYDPTRNPERYRARLADLADPDSDLRRYLAAPDNLLAVEDAARSVIVDDNEL